MDRINDLYNIRRTSSEDPVIFGLPDPVLFLPDPDPTCYKGIYFMLYFYILYIYLYIFLFYALLNI